MEFYCFDTPLGQLALAQEGDAITRLYLPDEPLPRVMPHPTPLLVEGQRQLLEYCAGQRQHFDLPLNPEGTPFRKKVWNALLDIPYGQLRSYKDIAVAVNCPRGFQAIGQANHHNPIPIIIPCHRVIAADGSIGGYSSGETLKRALLAIEGISLSR